jgi:hypothetical protein
VKMDPRKIEVILNWSCPQTLHDIQSFHGLTSLLPAFHKNF